MQSKPTVLLLGKLPPPYMGPAIATSVLLRSDLKTLFRLVHFDTRLNKDIRTIGRFRFTKFFSIVKQVALFARTIRQEQPDVVVVPISQSIAGFIKDSFFILIAARYERKIIVHLRGSEFRDKFNDSPFTYRLFARYILKKCNGAIVLGENLRPIFSGLIPDSRIFVCPNGCNLELPERDNIPHRKISLLSIGNLQTSKGILDILGALCLLSDSEREKIRLDVLGAWRDDPTRTTCLGMIEEHRLPVRFIPSEESAQKNRLLSNADIFLFTPRAPEGHPWVIVEAMAAGLPIISTDRGAIVESVIDGENGYIVPLNDPAAIANRLSGLIQDSGKRQRMGQLSRKKYESAFTEKKMVERLYKIILQVQQSEP